MHDLVGLGTATGARDDVKGDLIAFLQRLEAVALDGAVVRENVGTSITATDEAVAFGVVEPPDRACVFGHEI